MRLVSTLITTPDLHGKFQKKIVFRYTKKGVGEVYRRALGLRFPDVSMVVASDLVGDAALFEVRSTAVGSEDAWLMCSSEMTVEILAWQTPGRTVGVCFFLLYRICVKLDRLAADCVRHLPMCSTPQLYPPHLFRRGNASYYVP
jgi:hypothetical protein